LLFYYFSSLLRLRYLHSFPTRRSSDLQIVLLTVYCDASLFLQLDQVGPDLDFCGLPETFVEVHVNAAAHLRNRVGSGDVPPHLRDRKSTRLNSSHRTISYAVFCLKKKK